MQRRERTRHLIELGGLVQKAGLVELADDDRATLYGAMLDLAARAQGDDADNVLALWKRRGKRAFDAEAVSPERGDYTKVTYLHAKGEQIRYDASRCYSQAFLPLLCGAALRAPIWEGGNPIDQRSR